MARKTKTRYELKEKLGEGGMGVVWRAHDTVLNADVALKMLLDVADPSALKLFYDECNRQAALVHPNVIEIRDVGAFEDDDGQQPYLVMPLLRGKTLGDLTRESREPIAVERCIDIFTQACRGLQAAHDHGLLHRDIKPNNIFILDDDSVKIIDFGVAHRLDLTSTVGRKGTLLYMSPEQVLMKPLSRASDVFSLAVVCYEALTGKHPFARPSEVEIADAIQHLNPPSASSLNVEVSGTLSQVVHKAMAKQASHRFSSAKEFGDLLRRAYYDGAFAVFDPAKFAPRLQKAAEAFESGDLGFAQEMVNELESEGYLSTELETLAVNVKAAVEKRDIEQLLSSARARVQDGEYRLALQRVTEALQIDDRHQDALALKHDIEARRAEADVLEWLRVGQQHLEKFSFSHARQAGQRILELNPGEERALQFLTQVERKKSEYQHIREQKNQVYAAALEAEKQNDISAALSKMKQVLELDKQAPEIQEPSRSAGFQSLYNKLRAEHEAIGASYAEAKQALESGDYSTAAKLCDQFLEKYPQHTLFKALKFDNDQRWRRAVSSQLIQVEDDADREPDLDRRVAMLESVVRDNPEIAEFGRLLEAARGKRELVNGIVSRARELAQREQYSEALVQWETLQTIHPAYIGLDFEIDNMRRRRQFAERAAQKKDWIAQIDRAVEEGDLEESLRLLSLAKEDFPQDGEFQEIEKGILQQQRVATEAKELIRVARACLDEGDLSDGLSKLRQAHEIGSKVAGAKAELVEGLLRAARASQEDTKQASGYLREILNLEPGNAVATGMLRFLDDQLEAQRVDDLVFQARQLKTSADYAGATKLLEDAIREYPKNDRLKEFLHEIEKDRSEVRSHDLEVVRRKRLEADHSADAPAISRQMDAVKRIAERYQDDEEFQNESRLLDARLQTVAGSTSPMGPSREATEADARSACVLPASSKANEAPGAGSRKNPKYWIWAAALASLVVSIAAGRFLLGGKPHPTSLPRPGLVTLHVHTVPGADISVDGKPAGTSDSNGAFALAKLASGRHKVEVRLLGNSATKDVVLRDSDASSQVIEIKLEKGPGTVVVVINPPETTLTVSRADGQIVPVSGIRFKLPEGQYRFTARASHFQDHSEVVNVPAGGSVSVDLTLVPVKTLSLTPPQPSKESAVMQPTLEKRSWVWDRQYDAITHKSIGFALFSAQPSYGTYTFTAPLEKTHLLSKSRLEWVAGFIDPRNYVLFSIDQEGFESYTVRDGQRESHGAKIPLPKLPQYSIMMQIQPGRITTSLFDGKSWKLIEDWTNPPRSLDPGKFGFKDQITVYRFAFSRQT